MRHRQDKRVCPSSVGHEMTEPGLTPDSWFRPSLSNHRMWHRLCCHCQPALHACSARPSAVSRIKKTPVKAELPGEGTAGYSHPYICLILCCSLRNILKILTELLKLTLQENLLNLHYMRTNRHLGYSFNLYTFVAITC